MPISIQTPHGSSSADSSYSMLFSPGASSLGSTPGGGMSNSNNNNGYDGSGIGGGGAGGGATPTGNSSNINIELEVQWEPSLVKTELLQASALLSHRCLKYASNWAAAQMNGIPVGQASPLGGPPPTGAVAGMSTSNSSSMNAGQIVQDEFANMNEVDWYAKSLVELGEYLHAAAILSQPAGSTDGDAAAASSATTTSAAEITQIGPPTPGLSSYGFYLRAYSLYMAGERRKEEDYVELQSEAQKLKGGGPRNPYLQQLVEEVSEAYDNDELDVFGCYVYGLILKEAKMDSLACPHRPHAILVESIVHFPYNWSAWLDLYDVLVGQPTSSSSQNNAADLSNSTPFASMSAGVGVTPVLSLEQEIEQVLQPALATNYMYHFFCAHLMTQHHQAHEEALTMLERLYEPLPEQPLFQSPQIRTQMAVIHYHLREFEQALQWFEDASLHPSGRYSLDHKDVYSNILFVKQDRVGLSHLAHESVVLDKYRPETCCIIGNYYSLKQQRQKAVLYFQRALKLDRNYTSALILLGHEYIEMKQTEAAMESYRRAVNVGPSDYRAWYGLGQTYELLNMHMYALFYYRKAAVLRPYDARMWCAVGQCFASLMKIQDAIRAYEKAVAQQDHEGIATQKLATLYRNDGRTEEAARCYLRHLELRYLVTDPDPAMEQPTLDAIVHGVVLGPVEAEALLFLAQYHKTHGEYDTAALMASRLVEWPGHSEKEHAKALLRDIRSRGRRAYPTRSAGGGGGADNSATTGSGGGNRDRGAVPQSPFQFSP